MAAAIGSGLTAGEVLVTWPDYDVEAQGLGRALAEAGLQIRLEPKRGRRDARETQQLLDGVAGAIVSTDPFDEDLLVACPQLRVIARVGVGVDSIDLDAATRCGVAVTITPGANEETVADHTLALMLALVRRICEHDADIRNGGWNRTGVHAPWTLSGRTVGIVGFGRIGKLVARRLSGFDVEVLVNDPMAPIDGEPPAVDLDDLLARSDVVTLHVPLTRDTRALIGSREFRLMRSEAILINTARGGVLDEGALLTSLREGSLRGAALDVFEEEPPRDWSLLHRPNVVLSPHNAGLSVESIQEMTHRATASVIDVLSGRAPDDLANPEVGDSLDSGSGARASG